MIKSLKIFTLAFLFCHIGISMNGERIRVVLARATNKLTYDCFCKISSFNKSPKNQGAHSWAPTLIGGGLYTMALKYMCEYCQCIKKEESRPWLANKEFPFWLRR
jgi:hypothetical protein